MNTYLRSAFVLVIIASIFFFSEKTTNANNGKVFFDPDTTVVQPLDTFYVNIEVDPNVTTIKCFLIALEFDTSLIQLMDVSEGSLFSDQGNTLFFWNDDVFPYEISDCLLGYGRYVDGPGVLATMTFRAKEQAGNTPLSFTHVEITDTVHAEIPVDSLDGVVVVSGDQAPSVGVASPPSGGTYNYLPTLSINFSDDWGLDRGFYQMDNCQGTWIELWSYNSASSDTTIEWTFPSVSEGAHSVYFKVTDDMGNTNSDTCSYSWTFTYDITEPMVSVASPPSGGTYDYLPTLDIDLDDDAGLDRGYYQIDSCGGIWIELWSYNSASLDTAIHWTVPIVSEGLHSIFFKITDDAGNVNGDTCSYSWTFTYVPGQVSLMQEMGIIGLCAALILIGILVIRKKVQEGRIACG